MAVGDIVSKANAKKSVCLATGLNATNAAPAAAGDGIPVYPTNQIVADDGHCYTTCPAMSSTLVVKLTGTSATVALWGYLAAADAWCPIVPDGAASSDVALTESTALRYLDLGHFDELYLECSAISAATLEAWLTTSRTVDF